VLPIVASSHHVYITSPNTASGRQVPASRFHLSREGFFGHDHKELASEFTFIALPTTASNHVTRPRIVDIKEGREGDFANGSVMRVFGHGKERKKRDQALIYTLDNRGIIRQ